MERPATQPATNLGGYILAGGRSSRMGTDKALLPLAGKPLIQHAVTKLRRICTDVRILSANPALAAFAPVVPDLHPNCGPIGGIEAALTHSPFAWNLFLPVDMPFLPSALIAVWVRRWLGHENDGARIRMFTVDGRPQPGFCFLHREILPSLSQSIDRGEFKLLPALEAAGRELALHRGLPPEAGLSNLPMGGTESTRSMERLAEGHRLTEAQRAAQPLWFANLNTLEDFAEAEANLAALDT